MKALICSVPLDIGIPREIGELPVVPKIAVVSLIKWMERNGFTKDEYDFYDVDMLDPSDEDIRKYFLDTKPDVIGFSAVVSTTYTQVQRLARIAREVLPDAWLVLGGSLSASANVALRKTDLDLAIQSDGENPWVEFLSYVKAGHRNRKQRNYNVFANIKGLSYLDPQGELQFTGYPEKIPSSENPYPDYDILYMGVRTKPKAFDNYFRDGKGSSWFRPDPRSYETHRGKKVASLWTTKGCVARCTFCQRSTKGYATNSVTTLDEHLKILKEKYDVGFVHVVDENFGSDKKHAYEVARTMKKHDLLWICSGVRCVSVNREDARFYHEHNCSALKFGVESGSQKILDMMEKRFTVEQVYAALRACTEEGLYSPIAVMAGMPGETLQTAKETGTYLGTIGRMLGTPPGELGIAIFHALPLPGTPLYQYGQHTGVIGRTVEDEEKYLIAISDRGSEKDNYLNLNGSPMKEMLFWEFLMRYQATRTYYGTPFKPGEVVNHNMRLAMKRGMMPTDIHGVEHSDEKTEMSKLYPSLGSLTHTSLQATRFLRANILKFFNPKYVAWWLHYKSSNFISLFHHRFCFNPFVAKLPEKPLYLFVQYSLYGEYLYRKTLRKVFRLFKLNVKERNLFNDYNFPAPIKDADLTGFQHRIERSLRNLVDIRRDKTFKPKSVSESNQELLNMGR